MLDCWENYVFGSSIREEKKGEGERKHLIHRLIRYRLFLLFFDGSVKKKKPL